MVIRRPLFHGDQRRDIGDAALTRGARHAAARLLSHTDTTIAADAYAQIALLFYQHAEWASSRDWWQKAVSTGHPDQAPRAMANLGTLETRQGDLAQARHWYLQAIATGHSDSAPSAMAILGLLEVRQGDPGLGRHWLQQAVATGQPKIISQAQQELRALDRHEHERQEGERFGRYGYLAYADPGLMNQDDPEPTRSSTDSGCDDHATDLSAYRAGTA